jgi:hypothetical protein
MISLRSQSRARAHMTRTALAGGRVYRLNRPARRRGLIHQIRLIWRRSQAN